MLEAELESKEKMAALLQVNLPDGWPPGEYDSSAVIFFRDCLAENPSATGWYGWYAVFRPSKAGPGVLIGAGGFLGPPDEQGIVEVGYSVVSAYERQGFATEMVDALVHYAFSNKRVKRIIAHTPPSNAGSIKVLERTGFVNTGPGREPGMVRYAQDNPSS